MKHENDGFHNFINAIMWQFNGWQITIRKFWQRTERGKWIDWVNIHKSQEKGKK